MHSHSFGLVDILFQAANLTIAAGYLSVPFLVLRDLPLSTSVKLTGAGFFVGCMGTHLWMVFGHAHHATWWWTAEHVAQACFTWAFILIFTRDLRRAQRMRRKRMAEAVAEVAP